MICTDTVQRRKKYAVVVKSKVLRSQGQGSIATLSPAIGIKAKLRKLVLEIAVLSIPILS